MSDPEIGVVDPTECDRAIAVQVLAFCADPAMRWTYPEARSYVAHFPDFARAFAGSAFERGTAYATGDFAGVSFWLPVGAAPDGDAIEEVIGSTVDPARLDGVGPVLEQMERFHPEEPHWYLAMIGVDPARQGRGVGAALLRHTLALCDADGVPAYLESSNPANIPLYLRHGFEVMGEIREGDFPVITPMLRPARA